VIISDNGPQFVGKKFAKYGITHVKSSPYHPQGNGVVERLHHTLNAIITKTTESKGNWASVVPMALFFIRSVPCHATGASPFLAKQGWEPATPLQLMYGAWVDQDLRDIDIPEFIVENTERIENLREECSLNLSKVSEERKVKWDRKAKVRSFEIGEEVLARRPGMCGKLEDSWDGPYTIHKKTHPYPTVWTLGIARFPLSTSVY